MRKHKKTRQEKIISDLHRKIQIQRIPTGTSEQYTITQSLPKQPFLSQISTVQTYVHLKQDLTKIFLLTSGILILETILFFILKHNIVTNLNLGF